jgi:hypothetical protein
MPQWSLHGDNHHYHHYQQHHHNNYLRGDNHHYQHHHNNYLTGMRFALFIVGLLKGWWQLR